MTAATRCRLLVKVEPQLLAETLSRVLRHADEGVDVIIAPERIPRGDERYDIAVITDGDRGDVNADIVVRLPGERGNGVGNVTVEGERYVLDLRDVASLVALVRARGRRAP